MNDNSMGRSGAPRGLRKNRARSEPRYCTRETKGFNPLFKCVTKVGADYEGKFRASENPDPYE